MQLVGQAVFPWGLVNFLSLILAEHHDWEIFVVVSVAVKCSILAVCGTTRLGELQYLTTQMLPLQPLFFPFCKVGHPIPENMAFFSHLLKYVEDE